MAETLQDMSLESVVKAIEENLFALFKSFGALPGAEINDHEDDTPALTFVTGLNSPMFNGVANAKFPTSGSLDDGLDKILTPFKSRGLPIFWWTGPATQPLDLDEQLLEYGMTVNMVDTPGLALDLATLPAEVPPPSGLTVERVSDSAALADWCRAFTMSYSAPDSAGDAWVSASTSLGLGPDLPWTLYIGRVEGEPVAVSLLFPGAGVAGIYAVGTVPEMRGQGIGTAITMAPLLDARQQGYKVAILHASDLAVNLYRRLGFKEYCKINRYTLA